LISTLKVLNFFINPTKGTGDPDKNIAAARRDGPGIITHKHGTYAYIINA
jgi:hypothetical protein